MPLTSDDVNALILQYLAEAGYQHSAFIFGKESLIGSAATGERRFEAGALVALIQKGIQYQELLAQDSASGESAESTYRRYPVAQLLATPDATKLAAPERDATTEHAGKPLHGHTADVLAVAWSPQSAVLATAAADSTARLWHLQGAGSEAVVPCDILQHHQVEATGAAATVHALAWAPDASWVATAAFDGLVRVWGSHGHLHQVLRLEGTARDAPDQVTAIAASPCGARLAATSMNASVGVWDAASGALLRSRHSHTGGALALAWLSPTALATCGTDGAINVLELARAPLAEGGAEAHEGAWDLQHVLRLQGHGGHVNCAAASPDGTRLCTGSDDGTARLWQVERDFGQEDRQLHCFGSPAAAATSGSAAVLQCAFRKAHPSGNQEPALLVATCGRSGAAPADANVRVWDCDTGKLVHEWRAGAQDAVGVAWSPCGAMVAAAAADATARVWDVNSGSAVLEAAMPEAVMSVQWSRDGSLAVGLCGGGVRVLDLAKP